MNFTKKGIDDLPSLSGKKVIVRVDYNVPIENGKIMNDFRIRSTVPTINKIIDQKGKCILMSHMGRPRGVSMVKSSGHRENCKKTWLNEKGSGKTAFFAELSQDDKVEILEMIDFEKMKNSGAKNDIPEGWDQKKIPNTQGSGKVAFFANLSEDMKTNLLNMHTEKIQKKSKQNEFLRDYCGFTAENTLQPVSERLSEILDKKIQFCPDCLNAKDMIDNMNEGDILLLENLRFYSEETTKNEKERLNMATILSEYGDYFICDCFGTAHREAASITGIPKILNKGVAGYLMKKELESFSKVLTNPSRPMCAIVGGAKVSDKIKVLENLISKVDYLLIGGAMSYAFLKAKGISIGDSFCEKGQSYLDSYGVEHSSVEDMAKDLLEKIKSTKAEVYLPIDHSCNTEFADTKNPLTTENETVPGGYMALDIGPKTRQKFCDLIKKSGTVVWNGPVGVFELNSFSQGTQDMLQAMSDCSGMTVIGGGDSATACEKYGFQNKINHVSTGGGASLELLEGKVLPGVAALEDA